MMSRWVNGSLDELLGLAPMEPTYDTKTTSSAPPPRAPEAKSDEERHAAIDATLEAMRARDRERRARSGKGARRT